MTFEDALKKLQAQFPTGILGTEDTKPDPAIKVDPKQIHEILLYLRDQMNFETLSCISGVDYPKIPALCVVYHPFSYSEKCLLALKAYLPREEAPSIASVTDIHKGANWMERETYDLVGIHFTGHPDHRRILCPDDWTGHPLRKDYVTPDYYNGMPVPLYFDDPSQEGSKGENA